MKKLGQFNGEAVRIHFPERKAVEAPVPNPVLFVGDAKIVLDVDRMDGRMARQLPGGLFHASIEDLRPFLIQLAMRGLI